VLPPLGLCAFERLAFGSTHLAKLLAYRLSGGFSEAFVSKAETATKAHGHIPAVGLSQIDLGKFLASPHLWVGLIFAAACLAGAVWLRRRREPI
jgi:ABC-2 type transport system permease protein